MSNATFLKPSRYAYLYVAVLAAASISIFLFFRFTAEDAFITYRYAENLINTGALVYNEGEPINAMTSPLHAILSAVLFLITGQTVLSNKIVALLLLLATTLIIWRQFRSCPPLQPLALSLMLMPPAVFLWTFGGLETPILLFLITTAVAIACQPPPFRSSQLFILFFLAALAFLTRYDSVLFLLPIVVYAVSKGGNVRQAILALLLSAILPIAWFGVSVLYYGDLLPTSFYVKTPNGNFGALLFNGIYISSYLFFVGVIPMLALVFFLLRSKRRSHQLLYQHFKRMWWLYLGLFLELIYGLTMATHHMMFSFRFFVPYLPAAVILIADLIHLASDKNEVNLSAPGTATALIGFVLALTLFQLYQTVYTYNKSVNGISFVGEYRSLGVRDYTSFIDTLEQEARDIERHWNTIDEEKDRRPRIITYAAGMLPYTFRDSYIYEKLVSYRHCHQRYQQALHADYIHILAPRQGEVEEQLPGPAEKYLQISSYELFFDGSWQNFLVYYNPSPEPHNLTARIAEPCEDDS